MKKMTVLLFISIMILLSTGTALALTGPVVSPGHGDVSAAYTSGSGFSLGVEYGLFYHLGIIGNISFPLKYSGGGLKWQLGQQLAVKGGMLGLYPYLAFNGSSKIVKNLDGVFEMGSYLQKGDFSIYFEWGLLYHLPGGFDIRVAAAKRLEKSSTPDVEAGVGFNF